MHLLAALWNIQVMAGKKSFLTLSMGRPGEVFTSQYAKVGVLPNYTIRLPIIFSFVMHVCANFSIYLLFTDAYKHCVKFLTHDNSSAPTQKDKSHKITVNIRYKDQQRKSFRWIGVKPPGSTKTVCKHIEPLTTDNTSSTTTMEKSMLLIEDVWIRQSAASKNKWSTKSIQIQDYVGSRTFKSYSLNRGEMQFWTTG